MKNLLIIMLSVLTFVVYGQAEKKLRYTHNRENIVASAIDGTWKLISSEDNYQLNFTEDTTVIDKISIEYYEVLKDFVIYNAGYMRSTRNSKTTTYPFILTAINGNPHLVYFRKTDSNPIGDSESFNLVIAKGASKNQDRLFTGGDFNNQAFKEFKRIE